MRVRWPPPRGLGEHRLRHGSWFAAIAQWSAGPRARHGGPCRRQQAPALTSLAVGLASLLLTCFVSFMLRMSLDMVLSAVILATSPHERVNLGRASMAIPNRSEIDRFAAIGAQDVRDSQKGGESAQRFEGSSSCRGI